ncbi:MAG: CDGSH iron-sulfur domain-containing protein [Steroidobacteraceae bacterium]|jgi:CDGSH-type Zn-finger protein
MADPVVAARAPMGVDLEAGKTYYWCACGKSANQPFCDGSHKGSEFTPRAYTPSTTGKAYLCACKHTHNAPLCDGSHKALA